MKTKLDEVRMESPYFDCPAYKGLRVLVESFTSDMLKRMIDCKRFGQLGYNEMKFKAQFAKTLSERIGINLKEADWIDIANLAMIAWNLKIDRAALNEEKGGDDG